MAKSGNRGGGEGTTDRGGVRTTFYPPFPQGSNRGSEDGMGSPFNAPRTGGDNGLPTHVYDDMGGMSKGQKASSRDSLGTIWTDPTGPRR